MQTSTEQYHSVLNSGHFSLGCLPAIFLIWISFISPLAMRQDDRNKRAISLTHLIIKTTLFHFKSNLSWAESSFNPIPFHACLRMDFNNAPLTKILPGFWMRCDSSNWPAALSRYGHILRAFLAGLLEPVLASRFNLSRIAIGHNECHEGSHRDGSTLQWHIAICSESPPLF